MTKYNIGDILLARSMYLLGERYYLIENIDQDRYFYRSLLSNKTISAHYLAIDENPAFTKVA